MSTHIRTHGKFQSYPDGILNPSFCGMTLWELSPDHIFNDYKVCGFHQIKSGIILYGNMAYVFTPIENNDIKSHLKILLRNKRLKYDMSHARASKLLVDYIRREATRKIIPSISNIQSDLYDIFGINDRMYITEESTYLTLLHRIYILLFMLRYQMPIQRKSPPGNRNLATSVLCFKGKGWYSKLMPRERKILNDPCVTISSDPIPEDLVNGVSRSDLTSFSKTSHIDKQNSSMFRDKSMDSILFQQKIHQFRFIHSCNKQTQWKPSNNMNTNKRSFDRNILQEVPSINYLREQVKLFTDGLNITKKISNLNHGPQCFTKFVLFVI